jgi:hypothetical protein
MHKGIMAWVLFVCGVCAACGSGGSSSEPIDQIPPDTKLVDLNPSEMQGVCDWVRGVAAQKLSGANCNGSPITFTTCKGVPSSCPATVAEYQACFPNFLDGIASDPCQVIDFAFSMSDLEAFVNATPGCMGLAPCVTSMP